MPYSEQQIRGLAINFLRFYYKLRPRHAGEGTRVVDQPHEYRGILIDARMAYQKPDQSWFTATVEASSIDRTSELYFRTDFRQIAIHALLITLILLATFVCAGTQMRSIHLWRHYGNPEAYLVLLTIFASIFLLVGALLGQWHGYRKIYAVEQFKQFFADAQWVAYDAEIFAPETRHTRRYYAELERQCVKHGFGILEVGHDKAVRNVMSPSQVDQFQGRRWRLPAWVAKAGHPLSRAKTPAFVETSKSWIKVLGLWGPPLLLLGWGVYAQASYSPLAREGRKGAEPDLTALEATTNPAPPLEIEEGEYLPTLDTGTVDQMIGNLPEAGLVTTERIEDQRELRRYRLLEDGGVRIDYDCVPLYQLSEPVFLLLFGRYDNFTTARGWAEELNRLYQTPVTVAAGDCVEAFATAYLVYLDVPMTEEAQANFRVRALLRDGLEVEVLEINRVRPVGR